MNLIKEIKELAKNSMNNVTFNYYLKIAQDISKKYEEIANERAKVHTGDGYMYPGEYYNKILFLTVFFHKYVNMISGAKVPADISSNGMSILTSAYYDPATSRIAYNMNSLIAEKSGVFSNIMEVCFHENRHGMQFKAFETGDIEKLINYDWNSIIILKDMLAVRGNSMDYHANHKNSLMEFDANAYAVALSNEIMSEYFREHQDTLKYSDMYRKIFDFEAINGKNPFEILVKKGLVDGEYRLRDRRHVDRAIMLDKNLKKCISPELVKQYPILNLIWKNGKFKTYSELMEDKNNYLRTIDAEREITLRPATSYQEKTWKVGRAVENIYDAIIKSDPMLYLESLISEQQFEVLEVTKVFDLHPTLKQEYEKEIRELLERKLTETYRSKNFTEKRKQIVQLIDKLELNRKTSTNNSMQNYAKNAINQGVNSQTVNGATKNLPLPQTTPKEKNTSIPQNGSSNSNDTKTTNNTNDARPPQDRDKTNEGDDFFELIDEFKDYIEDERLVDKAYLRGLDVAWKKWRYNARMTKEEIIDLFNEEYKRIEDTEKRKKNPDEIEDDEIEHDGIW